MHELRYEVMNKVQHDA